MRQCPAILKGLSHGNNVGKQKVERAMKGRPVRVAEQMLNNENLA
jgi:hypothetical protein